MKFAIDAAICGRGGALAQLCGKARPRDRH
jgi:hypothetical protein